MESRAGLYTGIISSVERQVTCSGIALSKELQMKIVVILVGQARRWSRR